MVVVVVVVVAVVAVVALYVLVDAGGLFGPGGGCLSSHWMACQVVDVDPVRSTQMTS